METVRKAVDVCWLVVLGGFILFKAYELLAHLALFTTIVVGAIFFAYLIFPVVGWLTQRLRLGVAIGVVYLAIILLISGGVYFVIPAVSGNVGQFVHDAPSLVHQAHVALIHPTDPVVRRVPAEIRHYLAALPDQLQTFATQHFSHLASRVFPVILSIFAVAALIVAIPVMAAYLLAEATVIKEAFLGFIPARKKQKALEIIADLDHVVGGFLRGQVIVAAIVGSLVTILLYGLHVRYAYAIGAAAGILDVIPYVGAVAGWVPAFLIAISTNGIESGLYVTIGIILINQLEGHVIAPRVVSKTVELTPLAVIVALLAGGEIAGIPGLLLAVPIAGALRVIVIDLRPRKLTYVQAEPALPENANESDEKEHR